MYKKKFYDLEATILDFKEREKYVTAARKLFSDKAVSYGDISIPMNNGQATTGTILAYTAQTFESAITNQPLNKVIPLTDAYLINVDILIAQNPEYHELYFVNGKNAQAGAECLAQVIVSNRELIDVDKEVTAIHKKILNYYDKSENYLENASKLIIDFVDKQNQEIFRPAINSIRGTLLSSVRAKVLYEVMTNTMERNTENLLDLTKKIILLMDENKALFKNGVFLDEEEVGVTLTRIGNVTRLAPEYYGRDGIIYFGEARKVLGNEPLIREGIDYLQEYFLEQKRK